MTATSIRLKKSSVTGRIPDSSDLAYGELAINYADGVLYYKNTSNSVASISGGGATTDSAAPTGGSIRDGALWWDAENGRLKVYYDDGTPTSSPITVSMTVNSTYTTNAVYSFDTGWTDRTGLKSYTNGQSASLNPTIVLQTGDTLTINNPEFGNHPLYFITQTGLGGSYDALYNVELPASNYGGGTATVSYQFNSAGTYYYICSVHAVHMIGTITVVAASTASKQWIDASPAGRGYTGSAGAVTQSESAPTNPAGGQIWYDTRDGKAYIYLIISGNGQWVLFSDPTVSNGSTGYTGSVGYTGSRGTISPRSITIDSPNGSKEKSLFYTATSLSVSEVRGVREGGTSVSYSLKYGNRDGSGTTVASDTVTSTTVGDVATISSPTIPAGNWVWIEETAVVGTPDYLSVNVTFTE